MRFHVDSEDGKSFAADHTRGPSIDLPHVGHSKLDQLPRVLTMAQVGN